MNIKEIIIALIIHVIIPLIGYAYFLFLIKKMKRENIDNAPKFELFIIISTYIGLICVCLTSFFWHWSGMASLGSFYLILIAPLLMGIISYRNRKSKYHKYVYRLSLLYFLIAPIIFLLMYQSL